MQLITLFKINVQHISFILLITRTPLERWPSSESVSGKDLLMNKRTRSCDVGLSVTSSDDISFGSSTLKVDGGSSKKEMKIANLEETSTDFLNENDMQQCPSYSIKRNKDYIHADAILKSP